MRRSDATATRVVVSCEHAGNRVPARWAPLFAGRGRLLASHRGFDPGAAAAAHLLARACGAPLHLHPLSRLLADANRSHGHPRLFSELTRGLPPREREILLAACWLPHRRGVELAVGAAAGRGGRVLHLSVHSFAPRLGGRSRGCDVGLLYDPARPAERALCARWRALLREIAPELRVRRNHPYRGVADGLTTYLRRRYPPAAYLGIELELCQARLRGARAAELRRALAASLLRATGLKTPRARR